MRGEASDVPAEQGEGQAAELTHWARWKTKIEIALGEKGTAGVTRVLPRHAEEVS
jgi:hypothetical protein